MDQVIDKPPRIRGYALHRMVAELHNGKAALFADEGTSIRIRPPDASPPVFEVGKVIAFTTTACVALRERRRHKYLPLADWRGRRAWFELEAAKGGFEVLAVHVSPGMQKIETHDDRRFSIDATEFTGVLRVIDSDAFGRCLVRGVGRVGKAFGLGLLVIN